MARRIRESRREVTDDFGPLTFGKKVKKDGHFFFRIRFFA